MSSSDQSIPVLCRNCSVFYGSARFDNYCSKCYNQIFGSSGKPHSNTDSPSMDVDSNNSQGGNVSTSPSVSTGGASTPLKVSQPIAIAGKSPNNNLDLKVSSSLPSHFHGAHLMDAESPEPSPGASPSSFAEGGVLRKKPNTCHADGCRKKLGLTAVECRCGHSFCSTHRYAEKHNCPFDYKGTKQELLKNANPLVAPSKIKEI